MTKIINREYNEEKLSASAVMKDLAKSLSAKLFYHPELKIISDDYLKVMGLCRNEEGFYDRKKVLQIKSVNTFPRLQAGFLEMIMGYRRVI